MALGFSRNLVLAKLSENKVQKGGWGVQPVNDKSQAVRMPMEAFDWLTCQTKRDVL